MILNKRRETETVHGTASNEEVEQVAELLGLDLNSICSFKITAGIPNEVEVVRVKEDSDLTHKQAAQSRQAN